MNEMASCARAALKRMLENADDNEVKRMHKRLLQSPPKNTCAVQSSPTAKWRPKSVADTRITIELLLNDVGLRVADGTGAIPPHEANMKVVGAEVVDHLRTKKGVVGNARASTVALSVSVASVIARAIEEANSMLSSEETQGVVVIEKNQRGDAPSWGVTSARGSGCSFNSHGKIMFKRALEALARRVDSMSP